MDYEAIICAALAADQQQVSEDFTADARVILVKGNMALVDDGKGKKHVISIDPKDEDAPFSTVFGVPHSYFLA